MEDVNLNGGANPDKEMDPRIFFFTYLNILLNRAFYFHIFLRE